ncbi:MAG: arginine repressor [Oscillospiraceae bacterium]|jgi:transcriptional regulator of arginine metabolism|uniref:arginine repressor n=1 Tax=Candidatus Pseudoscillospira sp. SGI.172 TaxID=3420582 RepID=UPI0009BB1E7C|nr:arginine repressor [Pseudoflavonifractor sp.]MDY3018868.1 arginine repressor [Oscillospiraceae bacterium]
MKSKRQQEILDIVAQRDIETQEQLLDALKERGVSTTQATISRDIKQLHLVKELTAGGIYKYAVSQRKTALNNVGRLQTIFRQGVTSYDMAQNIVVLRTMPGLASAAAAAIDAMEIPELVGSLAGDDTVILIMRTNGSAEEFCEEIREMLS